MEPRVYYSLMVDSPICRQKTESSQHRNSGTVVHGMHWIIAFYSYRSLLYVLIPPPGIGDFAPHNLGRTSPVPALGYRFDVFIHACRYRKQEGIQVGHYVFYYESRRKEICVYVCYGIEGLKAMEKQCGDARDMEGNARYTSGVSLHPSPLPDTAVNAWFSPIWKIQLTGMSCLYLLQG